MTATSVAPIRVSALAWAPPQAQGLVHDLRVRWALEEAGLAYESWLIDGDVQASSTYRHMQPFGQVPIYEEGDLVLFETGAILHHIAARSEVLMPADPDARARTTSWLFAALNSIEPFIMNVVLIDLLYADKPWAQQSRPSAIDLAKQRLQDLAHWLEGRHYLEDECFTVADLLMSTVLRIPRHTDLVTGDPVLDAYRHRCEARPAFEKAMADQLAYFAAHAPDGERTSSV